MARITYSLRLNQDGTITVKSRRQVEHISLLGKEKRQIYDAVKYALVSMSVPVNNDRLMNDLHHLIWRHVDA